MRSKRMITAAALLLVGATSSAAMAGADPPRRPSVEMLFTKKVHNRKPVSPGTTFTPGKLYCWTKLTNTESHYLIAHHWIKNGRRVWRQPIRIRSKKWVTWSHFKVTPGNWTVRVTDGSGLQLHAADFKVK